MDSSNNHFPVPRLAKLRARVAQESTNDPLIGAKLGSEEALELVLHALKTERGVHAETLMATTGALAGTSVQACLWEEARVSGAQLCAGLHRVRCHDGSTYWVGEPLNQRLMEGYGSPWQLLMETAHQEGCETLPCAETLLLEGLQRLGTPSFGHPQVAVQHTPQVLPPTALEQLWHQVQPVCEACCQEAGEWPLLCGLLAARALRLVRSALGPELALRLAMDAAIDASKRPLNETQNAA